MLRAVGHVLVLWLVLLLLPVGGGHLRYRPLVGLGQLHDLVESDDHGEVGVGRGGGLICLVGVVGRLALGLRSLGPVGRLLPIAVPASYLRKPVLDRHFFGNSDFGFRQVESLRLSLSCGSNRGQSPVFFCFVLEGMIRVMLAPVLLVLAPSTGRVADCCASAGGA